MVMEDICEMLITRGVIKRESAKDVGKLQLELLDFTDSSKRYIPMPSPATLEKTPRMKQYTKAINSFLKNPASSLSGDGLLTLSLAVLDTDFNSKAFEDYSTLLTKTEFILEMITASSDSKTEVRDLLKIHSEQLKEYKKFMMNNEPTILNDIEAAIAKVQAQLRDV